MFTVPTQWTKRLDGPMSCPCFAVAYLDGYLYRQDAAGTFYQHAESPMSMYGDVEDAEYLDKVAEIPAKLTTLLELSSLYDHQLSCVSYHGENVVFCANADANQTFFELPAEDFKALTPSMLQEAQEYDEPRDVEDAMAVNLLDGHFFAY